MAQWHLDELKNNIERRGWRVLSQQDGDEYRISATWVIQRRTQSEPLFIDFDGLDDLKTLPIEQSYGCEVREHPSISLYFSRKGHKTSSRSRRANWRQGVSDFVAQLDALEENRTSDNS